jgi:carbonic anhydrase
MMKKLLNGVIKFKNDFFEEHKEIFQEISNAQHPHTLYIGCSDSRIVPNLITKTMPGEVFVVRNIANMVPPYEENNNSFRCTASIIEYAVNVLEVENIVVCGHSNCGGCKALFYSEEKLDTIPLVKEWLKLGYEIRDRVLAKNLDLAQREFQTEQLNIVKQLENLLTYPFVEDRVNKGKVKLFGWYYVIETGDIFNYNFNNKEFELIEEKE